ncbi:MAG: hydantoinase B/oxoprolinase family protein [Solirubrobacterales bacterium]|nr:hydantoinase B/oxoprolinase family protein [Solirubrobacterales bacterium]
MSTTHVAGTYDVIDIEVHGKSIRNIANEMAVTLMRTSGSPVVTDAKDFSTCIMDAKNEQLAFSGFVTFHISTAVLGVQAVLERNPIEQIRPGDAFMCNDPHSSGAIHQGDVGIVMPFFLDGEIVGWGYVNEHVLDIGGSAVSGFALGAYDSFSETLAFPGTRIVRDGRIDPQWEQFLATNVRLAGTVLNDIRSMIAANNAGQRRLEAMLREIGLERFNALNEEAKRLSEQAVRDLISSLPDGTYDSTDWVEFDARGIEELHEVTTRLIVDGDEMTIQFRGGPQTDSFINGAKPAMLGQSWTTMLAQLTYDIPVNAGIWRPVHFDLGPQGTIVNASAPAPVSMSHIQTGMRVNKMLNDVFSQACSLSSDPRVSSRVSGQPAQNQTYFTAFGVDRRSGQPVVAFPMSVGMAAGGPAQTVTDGLEVYGATCMNGCDMPDVEIEETSQPGMILWRRIAPDTAGAGVHRGGNGVSTCLAILHCDRMNGGAYTNTAQVPPRGTAGGYPGAAGTWEILRDTNIVELLERGEHPTEETLKGGTEPGPSQSASLVFNRGDVYTVVHGGGSGVGDPLRRDPEMVRKDLADGYVSEAVARELYGVVLDGEGRVDRAATEQQRAAIRAARLGHAPEYEVRADAPLFAPLKVADGRWRCTQCDHDLGDEHGNWRAAAVVRENEISKRYAELNLRVRPRVQGEPVVLRENFCPGCGSSLSVDVTLEGHDLVAASRPGIKDPFAQQPA